VFQPPQPQESAPTWKPVVTILGGLFLVAIFGTLGLLLFLPVSNTGNQSPTAAPVKAPAPPDPAEHWNSTDGKIEALVMAHQFMERRLKAPSTADFPSIVSDGVGVSHLGGGVFIVNSYVDAQNSFGAKIRTRFICKLKDNGDKTWALMSLSTK